MDTIDTTLAAALIAAGAAIAAATLAFGAAARARRAAERAHAWERIRWALDRDEANGREYDIARTVLQTLEDLPWVPHDDRALAVQLGRHLNSQEGSTDEDL